MFSSFKKAGAEAREAEESKRSEERRPFTRLFDHVPGNDVWEYCSVFRFQDSTEDLHAVRLTYVNASGKDEMHAMNDAKGEPLGLIEIANSLGQAGWEAFNVTKTTMVSQESSRRSRGTDRDAVMEEELYFRRRLAPDTASDTHQDNEA